MRPRALSILLLLASGCSSGKVERAISAEESLSTFELDATLRLELVAAEPFVRDPVDLAFDEFGRAFVAEMIDYPFDADPGTAPGNRIRMLQDGNGDGRVDGSVIFADSIAQITGLQPWDGGLIVTSAPDILFLRDNDGDGLADERRVLFTGFAIANPQHRVSTPRFAIDNWIYVNNDGLPGSIAPEGGVSVSVLGADFRFRLDRPAYEPVSGPAQFGQAFDERGDRFITHNTVHVRHVVFPRTYLARNPFLSAGSAAHDISDHGLAVYPTSIPEAWRVSRSDIRARRYEAELLGRTERAQGVFTAVSGGAVYLADRLPYQGNLFTAEATANAVHRDVLTPSGATYVAGRAPEEARSEFLTSRDPSFRPVNVTVGPDGALYVVDMYRQIIESPEYIPESVRATLDFYSGTDRGRIYRIVPAAGEARSPQRWPGHASQKELIEMLGHPDQWMRLTAQRLLLEKGDRSAIPLLRATLSTGNAPSRLHALYVLESLEGLDEQVISAALRDSSPAVREHALRLAEHSTVPVDEIVRLAGDPDPRVRFQAVLSMGGFQTAAGALAEAAASRERDRWLSTAILTAAPELHIEILRRLPSTFFDSPGNARFVERSASVIGARGSAEEIALTLDLLSEAHAEIARAGFAGLAAGLDLAGITRLDLPDGTVDVAALREPDAEAVERRFRISDWSGFVAIAMNTDLPVSQRRLAVRKLATARFDDVRRTLEALLTDTDLQTATLETLGEFPRIEVVPIVMANWAALTGRDTAVRVLSARQHWLTRLLDGVRDGRIQQAAVPMEVRLRMLENPDASIRRRAVEIFRPSNVSVPDSSLELTGNPDAGRAIFQTRCTVCHTGPRALGPDLSGVSNKGREQLLQSIFAPDEAIPATYESYVAVLNDESIVSGRIIAESPGTLTFRSFHGDRTVLRSRIREIRQSSRSMMPAEAAVGLNGQDVADLIAYLRAAPE